MYIYLIKGTVHKNRDTCPNCGSGRHKKMATYTMASKIIADWITVVNLWPTTLSRLSRKRPRDSSKKPCWSARVAWNLPYFRGQPVTWLLAFVAGLNAVLPADLGINLQNVGLGRLIPIYPGCRSRRNVEFRC